MDALSFLTEKSIPQSLPHWRLRRCASNAGSGEAARAPNQPAFGPSGRPRPTGRCAGSIHGVYVSITGYWMRTRKY